eukprot:1708496-Prymnesium_polylepis.1
MLVLAVRDASSFHLRDAPLMAYAALGPAYAAYAALGLAYVALGPRAAARTQCIWLVAISSLQLARAL